LKNRLASWFICLILLVAGFLSPRVGNAEPATQVLSREEIARQLLERMRAEEKVGQLFLVTFQGPEAAPGTPDAQQIYDLIVKHHIGGVVLKRENNNFVGSGQTIPVLMSLTDQLQRNEFGSSLSDQTVPGGGESFRPVFIPLFIGISQNGDGYPYDQILAGMTTLPNQMALGATWQPELARQTGEVLGRELSILGINLFLGPSLDVLDPRFSESESSLGVSTFGGDPFWVGEMGRAYVNGVHEGSGHEITVVGKHFPGFGGSDRLPEEEVATIRKTLEQLKQFELYPFFALTGNAPSIETALDGLLTAHIRYQGFQENFRQTTKPISFDPQAFSNLMSLPAFESWRKSGGLMISDSLGSKAVRRFYDPTLQVYNGRTAALDAFLAGNDILFLDNFVSTNDPDPFTTITRTLNFFTQKYQEDPAFAQRVNDSVLRILMQKLSMYGDRFTFGKTQPEFSLATQLGQTNDLSFLIAKEAATLISPPVSELDTRIPAAREQIIFITDMRVYQQCSQCIQQNTIQVDALAQAVVRLYSPQAGGDIRPGDLSSYTYQDLFFLLESGVGDTELESVIRQAEWIVFLGQNPHITDPVTTSLRRFLDERPDLYQGKQLIVFSLNIPYTLDATEIAKLTAYYGLYGRSREFIEIAARLLFHEVQPLGASPVSIPGIGYDINRITFPAPNQQIPLVIEDQPGEILEGTPTPNTTPSSYTHNFGDFLDVRAGPIFDHNGHIVPDGTIVRFIIAQGGEFGTTRQVESQTQQGIARATIRIDSTGNMEVRAESEEARNSDIIQIMVPFGNITETVMPSETPTPSATMEPTPTETPTSTPEPTPETNMPEPIKTEFKDWFASLITMGIIAGLSFFTSARGNTLRWRVRTSLLALIGGILAYLYLALALPGSTDLLAQGNIWYTILIAALGAGLGWLVTLVWKQI
jgi:beta-N-acetylhexosaminidase